MLFAALPSELLLKVARQVDVITRLSLGSTCKAAAPLAVNAAVLEFRLSKRAADALSLCCRPENRCVVMLDNHRSGTKPVSTAKSTARKKGHVMPLYEALDPDSVRERTCGEERLLDEGGSLEHVCGTVGLKQPGSVRETGGQNVNRRVLPVGMCPSTVSFGLSEAALSALPFGAVPSRLEIPRVSCKTSLVVLDLSRAQEVRSLAAAGLTVLRVVRLPPSARIVDLEACTALTELRPTRGCPELLSLRLDGCRKLTSASFCGESWALGRCEELDMCWCAGVDAHTLASLLAGASSLRSLSLRGLRLSGVLESLHDVSCLQSLAALDLGFCSEVTSHAVQAFATSRPALLRCNLRAAATISAEVYNAMGELMLARASPAPQGDVVENRRRPKRLEQRAVEAFYYLKRSRQGEFRQ